MSFPSARVRNDCDPWNGRRARAPLDSDRLGLQREREIVAEVHDLRVLDTRRGLELERRDDRPGVIGGDFPVHVELAALVLDQPSHLEELPVDLVIDVGDLLTRLEEIHVGQTLGREVPLRVLPGLRPHRLPRFRPRQVRQLELFGITGERAFEFVHELVRLLRLESRPGRRTANRPDRGEVAIGLEERRDEDLFRPILG
jgi:hypothetical protein